MASGLDKAGGWGLVTLGVTVFLYYTVWVIILPFVDVRQHWIHGLFLPRVYAISVPLIAVVIVLACIGLFVIVVLLKSQMKKKKS